LAHVLIGREKAIYNTLASTRWIAIATDEGDLWCAQAVLKMNYPLAHLAAGVLMLKGSTL
jgi:hypothetical protein